MKAAERTRARRALPTARRQDLLAVTVNCLARLGPRGTTGREICRQAGVSHGLLRHYFDNPDNLLLETYQQLCDRLLAHLETAIDGFDAEPSQTLDRFFAAAFSEDWASPDVIGAWMVFWQLVRSRKDFAAVSDDFNARQRALLETIVQRLPAKNNPLPPADMIAILSAVMDGLWVEVYLSEDRTTRDRAVALCIQTARNICGTFLTRSS